MELSYSIAYSKRKKLTITVERDCSIVVRAPIGTSTDKIKNIIESKKLWLYEKLNHPQKYDVLPHAPGKELVNGESMLYLGRSYHIEMLEDADDIFFLQRFYVPLKLKQQGKVVFQQWYINKAKEKILPRIDYYAEKLGVEYNKAKITDSKYRWGSCSPKDNLNFNWRLVKAPFSVIDYVIVHELAHLLEENHTPRFWNIVKAQLPQMDKAKLWLKKHGALLEQVL